MPFNLFMQGFLAVDTPCKFLLLSLHEWSILWVGILMVTVSIVMVMVMAVPLAMVTALIVMPTITKMMMRTEEDEEATNVVNEGVVMDTKMTTRIVFRW